ncbi:MAG: nucleotidyl transferase AbiEii/AbiGii toxin family protein [Gloeobacteraceae cyanobacterium ES-bin-144]|nr:nucleotidyl transferase AbiEii/AbiGii toxin family protein [Verrucomicrobiales bacterium]
MTQRQFYDWQTEGGAQDVSRLVAALEAAEISWCMIGGLAVNHWAVEPMATADVDIVIVADRIEEAAAALKSLGFSERRFERSINLKGGSNVSIQISTEEMYLDFPKRSVPAEVHGILMRVASLEDTLAGKLAEYREPQRRPTKKLKDILDIGRLVEAHPELFEKLPSDIVAKLDP